MLQFVSIKALSLRLWSQASIFAQCGIAAMQSSGAISQFPYPQCKGLYVHWTSVISSAKSAGPDFHLYSLQAIHPHVSATMQMKAGGEVPSKDKSSTVCIQSFLKQKCGLQKQAILHLNPNQNMLLLWSSFLNIVSPFSISKALSLYN